MTRRDCLKFLLAAGAALPAAADAFVAPRLPFAARSRAGAPLHLLGAGQYYRWWFHIFDAALWVPGRRWRTQRPFALVLRYARHFDADTIARYSAQQMQAIGRGTPAQRVRWRAEMQRVFRNVGAGDRLTGLSLPGTATLFYYNDQETGAIHDPAFAPAFFAIWLARNTRAPDLRKALLGGP